MNLFKIAVSSFVLFTFTALTVQADTSSATQKMGVVQTSSDLKIQGPGLLGPRITSSQGSLTSTAASSDVSSEKNSDWSSEPSEGEKQITMIAGKSRVMRFKRRINRIAVSAPNIADALALNTNEVLINTKEKGSANLIVWDTDDNVFNYNLTVIPDPAPLQEMLRSIDPLNPIEIYPTDKGFVLKGNVATVENQTKVSDAAKAFSKESISIVTVKEAKQILLEIRFIEVTRTDGFEFGIDGHYIAEKVGFTFLGGGTGAALSGDGTDLVSVARSAFGFPSLDHSGNTGTFSGGYKDHSNNLQTYLKALETKNLAKVIARPNLLVRDGEEASFLVGGEFPVPTVTDNTININYKEFGTKLTYKPEILSGNKVRLKVSSEVSQLDYANAVTVNNFSIPALASRKANTLVELEDGYSLVIGGLIQQRKTEISTGTPILRRIPILGKLFSSTTNSSSDFELIVLVTPKVIDPKKEAFDINKVKIDNPIHASLEPLKTPFEDNRALAMEQVLNRFENERSGKDVVEDRKIQRDKLYQKMIEKKKLKRDIEFEKMVNDLLKDDIDEPQKPKKT